jgi:two-component system response regulator PilR (NtrC family)
MARLLLVEDEEVTRDVLIRALARDHQVVTADSVSTATKACSEFNPQVAILDWVVRGEGSGLDIARQLRNQCAQTRIIIVSGWPEELIVKELDGFRVSDILTKPITLEEIRAAVEKAVSAHS